MALAAARCAGPCEWSRCGVPITSTARRASSAASSFVASGEPSTAIEEAPCCSLTEESARTASSSASSGATGSSRSPRRASERLSRSLSVTES